MVPSSMPRMLAVDGLGQAGQARGVRGALSALELWQSAQSTGRLAMRLVPSFWSCRVRMFCLTLPVEIAGVALPLIGVAVLAVQLGGDRHDGLGAGKNSCPGCP